MRRNILFLISFLVMGACNYAYAQTVTDCPHSSGCVVISGDAARSALQAGDQVVALEAEIKTLKEAVLAQRETTVDVKIELAKAIGAKTAVEQEVIRQAAYIELLMKYGRIKKFGIINF